MIDINIELKRISLIKNKSEKRKQKQLLNEIIKKNNELCNRSYKYERKLFFQYLEKKNLKFTKILFSRQKLINKWIQTFAVDVDNKIKEEIFIRDNLWHIFSYKIKKPLIGKSAIEEFDKIDKDKIYIFYQNLNETYKIKDASKLKAKYLKKESDIYIVPESFQWTFVITHENTCGPYFYSIKTK